MAQQNYHLRLSAKNADGITITYLSVTPANYSKVMINAFIAGHLNRISEAVEEAIQGDTTPYKLIFELAPAETEPEVI
jgi:hypothetical protein